MPVNVCMGVGDRGTGGSSSTTAIPFLTFTALPPFLPLSVPLPNCGCKEMVDMGEYPQVACVLHSAGKAGYKK